MSGGKFSVFTLSYVNTAVNQSAFRIVNCYIIRFIVSLFAEHLFLPAIARQGLQNCPTILNLIFQISRKRLISHYSNPAPVRKSLFYLKCIYPQTAAPSWLQIASLAKLAIQRSVIRFFFKFINLNSI